jgi:hypothetical protein
MNEDFYSRMQSDENMWNMAEISQEDGRTVRIVQVPFGVGPIGVAYEEGDVNQRRSAHAELGAQIRAAVEDKIGEDAVTARAEQAAAKASYDADNILVDSGGDNRASGVGVIASGPEAVARRRGWVQDEIERVAKNLDALRGELRGLDAYVEVMNAQEDTEETSSGETEETEGGF